jgi:MFS superfamily sulfate permease-like transporter
MKMKQQPVPCQAAFRFDLIAGFIAAAIILPKAMAYATVAGVEVGLYTAFIPMIIYALLSLGICMEYHMQESCVGADLSAQCE